MEDGNRIPVSSPALRPMNVGDILDNAFSLYRKNFATLIGIVALVAVPLIALQALGTLLLSPFGPFTSVTGPLGGGTFALFSLTALLNSILRAMGVVIQTCALSVAVSERYFGRAVTIRQAYAQTLRGWTAILGASIVLGVINVGLFACSIFLLFVPVLIVLLPLDTRWLFTFQAIMCERLDGITGMRRSWQLVRGFFWRTLGSWLALLTMYYALSAGPTYLLVFLAATLSRFELGTIAGELAGGVIGALLMPIQIAALTLLYYDLRIRKEGFDLAMRASQLAETAA